MPRRIGLSWSKTFFTDQLHNISQLRATNLHDLIKFCLTPAQGVNHNLVSTKNLHTVTCGGYMRRFKDDLMQVLLPEVHFIGAERDLGRPRNTILRKGVG